MLIPGIACFDFFFIPCRGKGLKAVFKILLMQCQVFFLATILLKVLQICCLQGHLKVLIWK